MIFTKTAASLIRVAQVLGTMYAAGISTYLIVGLAKTRSWNGKTLAVEIISGAGFLYATSTLLLTICLLQKSFFQFGSILFDLLFCGAFVAVAVLLRGIYSTSCNASPNTVPWMEKGGRHYFINCQLTKGVFIVACILAFLFLLTAIISLLAHRKTKKDKAYGPSPSNGYTSGRGKHHHEKHDTEAVAGTTAAVPPAAVLTRPSHDSKFTDVTEKTSEGLPGGNTTVGAGREYLAPRINHTGTTRAVSPVPSQTIRSETGNSHTGQYAMAGALAGGAAAAHHHNNNNQSKLQTDTYNNNNLNNNTYNNNNNAIPVPEVVTTPEAARRMQKYTGHDPHLDGAIYEDSHDRSTAYSELDGSRSNNYSELGNTGASYGATPRHRNQQGLSELDTQNAGNLNYDNDDKRFSEYLSPTLPNTPGNELDRSEAGYGYGNQGQTGGNQVSRLPEMGREETRRF